MKKYWRDLAERVLASFAGGVLSVFGVGALDVLHADWPTALSVGAGAAVISILKGWVAKGISNHDSASLAPKV